MIIMDINGNFGFKIDLFTTYLKILVLISTLLQNSSTSDCDVQFVYSEYFNSNGFGVTCKDIQKGQENIIRYISAHNAIILYIRNATLENVNSDLFENVPKIRELTIEDSRILIDGDVDLFSKLGILQKLNLKNTRLNQIGRETFSDLPQIKFLHLENISLSAIPKDSLKLNRLETFEFINNELKDIEDVPLCNLPNIRVINFKKNRVKSLKPDLYQCNPPKTKNTSNSLYENNHISIENIDLSHNEITSLNGIFKSFTNLDHLWLENNSIIRISDTDFEFTTDLDYLNLSNNSISSISRSAFSRLYHLMQINLSKNQITNVHLKYLTQLNEINLAFNELTFENISSINNLPRLENLDLSYNKLNGSPNFFNDFPSLKTLNLNGNYMIPDNDTFLSLSKLEKLYLSNNGILQLPELIFNNLTSLIELDLSRNKLEVLDYTDVFSSLISLQMLNLSYNNIRFLNYTLFVKLDNVEVLDIAGNKLTYLDYPLIITNMRALETINVNNNLFSCNFLHRVVRYFAWKNINYKADNITYYEEENIGGIHCQEEIPVTSNSMGPLSERTSVFFIIVISAAASVFVLMLIIALKYYRFYRRNKYHCEQFELIED